MSQKHAASQTRRRLLVEAMEPRRLLTAEIEPNDTIGTATPLVVGQPAEGTLSSLQDADHFVVSLQQGQAFRLNTFNINVGIFDVPLPPGLELIDPSGDVVAVSDDSRDLAYVAPSAGNYTIRIVAENAFGSYVGDYGMQTYGVGDAPAVETEPNGLGDPDRPANLGTATRGNISSATDTDRFTITASRGDVVTVAFAGLPEDSPAAQLLSADGEIIAQNMNGQGFAEVLPQDGSFVIELSALNPTGGAIGDYVTIMNVQSNASVVSESGNGIESAADWAFREIDGIYHLDHYIGGVIESTEDADWFRFEVDTLSNVDIRVQNAGTDQIAAVGKTMTLYNRYGQIVMHSNKPSRQTTNATPIITEVTTDIPDALVPGVYYVRVSADSPTGTGAYMLQARLDQTFSRQRDRTIHYMDFDSDQAYLGFERVNAYAVPEAIDFYVGMFESRYAPFQVDVTRSPVTPGNEHVGQGIGDFGDIGAGGFGGGQRGQRSSEGNAVSVATETFVTNLNPLRSNTVTHEFGHTVGLPHTRDVQATMSYVGRTEYLPVGKTYAFPWTDSRVPGAEANNHRNFLDWTLFSGAQVVHREAGQDEAPEESSRYLPEMSIDHRVAQTLETGDRVIQVLTGDFNGDGRDDIVVANDNGAVEVFLADANGNLQTPSSRNVGEIGWWTEPLEVGDFNNDGRDDVIVGSSGDREFNLLLSNADGTLAAPVATSITGAFLAIATGDFNNDGNRDVVVTANNDQLQLFAGDGAGGFGPAIAQPTVAGPESVDAGDLNGDGVDDLVVGSEDGEGAAVYYSINGALNRVATLETLGGDARSVVIGDFNGDAGGDIAVVESDPSAIQIYLASGLSQYERTQTDYVVHAGHNLEATDVNADGFIDLIGGGNRISASVLLGQGDGSFTRPIMLTGTGTEWDATAADLNNDGVPEIITGLHFGESIRVLRQEADDPRNDNVVFYGNIDHGDDVDVFTVDPADGSRWLIDVDSAEFQMGLNARLVVTDVAGNVVAESDDAIDGHSAIESVDPFLDIDLENLTGDFSGPLTVSVIGVSGSVGSYRLKVVPERAIDQDAPRVIGVHPDDGDSSQVTNQIVVLLDDLIDEASLTPQTFRVTRGGATIAGTTLFNPLDTSIVWTANSPLPIGSYTLTIDGLTDLAGNLLDGETPAGFGFPNVSGDGNAGGVFSTSFSVNQSDPTPAAVFSVLYERDPYQRGRFSIFFDDQISIASVRQSELALRGAGPDSVLDTADDVVLPLDLVYDTLRATSGRTVTAYSRGVPDSGRYRLEGTLIDQSGHIVTLSENVAVTGTVPESALFADASLSTPGLTGSYVNSSLRFVNQLDWRSSQTISGTRGDAQVNFRTTGDFGARADVGVTAGADANWEDFSVQWDGFIRVGIDGTRLATRSQDGSRMWIDLDGDGVFTNSELVNNNWGRGQFDTLGPLSPALAVGSYAIRIQYEHTFGSEAMILEWAQPGAMSGTDGFIHGPSIVGTSIDAGDHLFQFSDDQPDGPASIDVTFSGGLDPATLTSENLFLHRSRDPQLFELDDEILRDQDGVIQWDASTLTATLDFGSPLPNGYYVLEVNGDVGGVTSRTGQLLDGEFLSPSVPGNNQVALWDVIPSGDGIQGGTFRSSFVISPPALDVRPIGVELSESGGSAEMIVTRLYADTSLPMAVTIAVSDLTELSAPRTVIIPSGQDSATFRVNGVDDQLLDGPQSVSITATAAGIRPGEGQVTVTDHEPILVTLSSPAISENRGTADLLISRGDASIEQTFVIFGDDNTEALVVSTVTLPVGISSTRVAISAVDDAIVDGTQTVNFTVTAEGMVTGNAALDVTDSEQLGLTLLASTLSERGGSVQGYLTRTDTSTSLTASLFTDPINQISVPTSVQFLAGQVDSVPFTITGIDNSVLDGARTVEVTANAPGYLPATENIEVTDFEPLSVQFDLFSISELDGQTNVRILRTDPSGPLTVTLQTSFDNALTVADSVTFNDGQLLSGPIAVEAVDDDLLTGSRFIDVAASAPGYEDGTATLELLDHEELSLALSGSLEENSDDATLTVSLPSAYVSADGQPLLLTIDSDLPEWLEVPSNIGIPAGQDTIEIPLIVGDNSLVDGDKEVALNAAATGFVGASVNALVQDDDTPHLTAEWIVNSYVAGRPDLPLAEADGRATLRLTRNTLSPLTTVVTTSLPGQFEFPASVTFPRNQLVLDIPMAVIDNDVVDGTRFVDITASMALHDDVVVTAQIADNEVPGLRVQNVSGAPFVLPMLIQEGALDQAITSVAQLRLTAAPLSDVVIRVDASTGVLTDVDEMTFTPANWDELQSVTFTVNDDETVRGTLNGQITFFVDTTQSHAAYRDLPNQYVSARIMDNDEPSIVVTETLDSTFVTELGITDSFSVRLGAQPVSDVLITIDNSEIESVSPDPLELVFTPENWDQDQTVQLQTDLDFNVDGNVIGLLFVGVSSDTTATGYESLGPRRLPVVHVDSDLTDLRVQELDGETVLVDVNSGNTLLQASTVGGLIATGDRNES
ncbi:MAG: FG-GAP-like repeat-containing protein, partial [Planctomycetota bacterium]